MAALTPLGILKQSTADLVALELRSESAVIARLITYIVGAVQGGHSHRSIHETIVQGGLATSWTNYRIAVGRARRKQRLGENAKETARHPLPRPVHAVPEQGIKDTALMPEDAAEAFAPANASSVTNVMSALREAREVALSKDYGQIGRDLYRQQQRELKNQRNTSKDRS